MPRASFWLAASDSVRAALHGSGRALYPRAEELPTPAGLFEHRPQRDYVAGTGLRRASGYPGHAAAHDFSFSDQTLAVLCAGNVQQHLNTDLFRKAKGGLIHSMPLTGAAFLMVTLAVTGSPPFSFFQSEFTVLRAGFSRGSLALTVLFVSFLVLIFSGFLVHISNLVLGEDP